MPERLIPRRHGTKPASSSSSVTSIPYSLEQRNQLAIQKLYNGCKQTFTDANGSLSDQALERIKFLLAKDWSSFSWDYPKRNVYCATKLKQGLLMRHNQSTKKREHFLESSEDQHAVALTGRAPPMETYNR